MHSQLLRWQLVGLIGFGFLSFRAHAVPAAGLEPIGPWRYLTNYPKAGWEQPRFDDASWNEGRGGFGDGGSFKDETQSSWRSGQIWLRGVISLEQIPDAPQLILAHRAEVQIYVNGHLAADVSGNTPRYVPMPVDASAQSSLKKGKNVITVHAMAIGEHPFIDVKFGQGTPSGAVAAPLYRDPRFDGAADPTVIWDRGRKCWMMFYTQRRANVKQLPGVGYCYECDVGMASSRDGGCTWAYDGEAQGLEFEGGRNTFWAPEVACVKGQYHMWVAYIRGVHTNWGGIATLVHFTSGDLKHWTFSDQLPMQDVIDAALYPLPSGGWRLFFKKNNQTWMADSDDLKTWKDAGRAAGNPGHEGPNVFKWKGHYWMIVDEWRGQRVYRSEDLTQWTPQDDKTILGEPVGTRRDDGAFGRHADVLVQGERAFIIYFTHPGGDSDHEAATSLHRTSVQVAELEYRDGKITCDRNRPLDYKWDPGLMDR